MRVVLIAGWIVAVVGGITIFFGSLLMLVLIGQSTVIFLTAPIGIKPDGQADGYGIAFGVVVGGVFCWAIGAAIKDKGEQSLEEKEKERARLLHSLTGSLTERIMDKRISLRCKRCRQYFEADLKSIVQQNGRARCQHCGKGSLYNAGELKAADRQPEKE